MVAWSARVRRHEAAFVAGALDEVESGAGTMTKEGNLRLAATASEAVKRLAALGRFTVMRTPRIFSGRQAM
jgi:hypothetical protein